MKNQSINAHRTSINTIVFAITACLFCFCTSENQTIIQEIEKLDHVMEKTQHTFDSILKNSEVEFERIESMKFDSTVNVDRIIITTEEY